MAANNLVLNKLFTQNVFQDLINYSTNTIYGAVVQQYVEDCIAKNNGELISEIYSFMSKSYRNEYFYLNTLLNKLLLKRHNINTAALTQIPIGKSKADFILINGKAVVYEIKTELDSFDRLETQLNDYFKAFNHVCVVTSEGNYQRLTNILRDTPVGICVLTNRNTISSTLKKQAVKNNSYLEHRVIFKVLHKNEYENIIKKHFGSLPTASQVFYYDECLAWFEKIPILKAYSATLKELKKRNKIMPSRFQEIPYELKSLMYFSAPTSKDYDGLNYFLNEKYRG
ncbi:MAG: sce7726 family protein [Firmicutes bacterium]|nr:sce7726 family protein [Bacillota bacterium]